MNFLLDSTNFLFDLFACGWCGGTSDQCKYAGGHTSSLNRPSG